MRGVSTYYVGHGYPQKPWVKLKGPLMADGTFFKIAMQFKRVARSAPRKSGRVASNLIAKLSNHLREGDLDLLDLNRLENLTRRIARCKNLLTEGRAALNAKNLLEIQRLRLLRRFGHWIKSAKVRSTLLIPPRGHY